MAYRGAPQSQSLSVLRGYLRQLNYQYQAQALNDASGLLSKMQSLHPNISAFRYPNGVQENLIVLDGTVPMFYRTKRYFVPVKIYLLRTHPMSAPLVFVCPTEGMMIKPQHNHVAAKDGRVYHAYLTNWNFQNRSNLYEMVNTLSSIFGEDPPCFKKPRGTGSVNIGAGRGRGGMMAARGGGSMMPGMGMHGHHAGGPGPMMGGGHHGLTGGSHGGGQGPPMGMGGGGSGFGSFDPSHGGGSHGSFDPSHGSFDPSGMGGMGQHHHQPPPPREPTPEEKLATKKGELMIKIQGLLQQFVKDETQSLDKVMRDQHQLEQSSHQKEGDGDRVRSEIGQMDRKIEEIETYIATVQSAVEAQEGKRLNVDEVIKIQDPLSRQYIDVNAENLAYDDVLYYLDKAMMNKVMSLDAWTRQVRKLAAKQFLRKALIQKIEARRRFAAGARRQ